MDNKSYKIKPGYILREIAGEFLAVPVTADSPQIIVLNPVSKYIWEQLSAEKTLSQLTEAVTSVFTVTPEEAEKDIKELLDNLESYGAI